MTRHKCPFEAGRLEYSVKQYIDINHKLQYYELLCMYIDFIHISHLLLRYHVVRKQYIAQGEKYIYSIYYKLIFAAAIQYWQS